MEAQTVAKKPEHMETPPTCAICLDCILPHTHTKTVMPCGHVFHHRCATVWLKRNESCPTCRCDSPAGDGLTVLKEIGENVALHCNYWISLTTPLVVPLPSEPGKPPLFRCYVAQQSGQAAS